MKTVTLTVLFLLSISFAVQAQDVATQPKTEKTKEEKAAEKAAKEKKEQDDFAKAGFTAEEVEKVKAITKETDDKVRAIKRNEKLTEEEKKTKNKELSVEKRNRIVAVVGEEKFKAWQKARKESATDK